jgi:hypothetical protein
MGLSLLELLPESRVSLLGAFRTQNRYPLLLESVSLLRAFPTQNRYPLLLESAEED